MLAMVFGSLGEHMFQRLAAFQCGGGVGTHWLGLNSCDKRRISPSTA